MPMQATTTSPLFSAALQPDRSPRLTGGWVAFVVAAIGATPMAVLVPGALLPVGTAFGIGAAALTALTLRQSRARRLRQQVTLWHDQIEIAVVDGNGVRTLHRFDPKSVRLLLERDDNEKTVRLGLRSGSDEVELGGFLRPEDRASFAKALGTALRRARQVA